MSLNTGWEHISGLKKRFLIISLVVMAIFLLLALRLWYLQIISTDRYRELSEKNRIRYIPVSAPRGPVYDRDGVLLIDNRPSFCISVLRQEVDDRNLLLERLASYLGLEKSVLEKRWQSGSRFPPYRPFPLAEDVSREVLEKVQENSIDLPGVLTEVHPLRFYPHGELAAHLFGYLGEITQRELQRKEFSENYRPGDFVGKRGLEKLYERYLRGVEGERRVEVDVRGRELRILKTQEPRHGNKVFLTLRHDLQQVAEQAFGAEAGAAVVLDVRTGEVLALVSLPSFNPELFARGISGQEWIELLQNPRHPLQDKTIQGQYPPGSLFKIVTALAALKAGVVSPATTVDCLGAFPLGNREFRCWKKGGHGHTDLKKALKESCDVWFYKISLEVGIDRIADMARSLGLGQTLGFALEGEKPGLIPDRSWKKRAYGVRWYDGETVIAAIGQGYVLATPLQLAVMTAAVANGGTVLRPQVVSRIEDLAGNVLQQMSPEVINEAKLAPDDLQAVRRGLEAVVNEAGGTAWSSRLEQIRIAGKTGTSQVIKLKDEDTSPEEIAYRFRDHALFAAYAPTTAPEIAVVVLVEHGGGGGSNAAPVAQKIIASYFGLNLENKADGKPPVGNNANKLPAPPEGD
ncbi:MAG: penicillin-binding protein 2 [Desulfuromonadaceae bacterium]